MPAINLTDEFVRAAKPVTGKQIEFPDAKVSGLALRVSAKGKKSWTFRFRNKSGRQRRLSLGTYPAIPLVKARRMALDALGNTQDGKDPAKERRDEKARAGLQVIRTVNDLANDYFAAARIGRHRNDARPKRESTLAMEEAYYSRLIKPKFGAMEIAELLRPDLQRFLDQTSKSSPTSARQCRNIIRQMYNFAISREITDRNPAQRSSITKSKTRDRVLTDEEIKSIWRICNDPSEDELAGVSKIMALALQFAMVTLQRGNEVCGATKGEVDLANRIWTIPGERTKNHRAHVVPLSDLAVSIAKEALALSSTTENGAKASGRDSPLFGFLRDGRPITRHAFTRAMKRLTNHLKIKDAKPHDFRRTGSTNMTSERLGIPRFHVSCVLNHISDTGGAAAVTAVYDRNGYIQEKRRALDKWATRLVEIVSESERVSVVVDIRRAH